MKKWNIADAHTDYLATAIAGFSSLDADIESQYQVSRPALLQGNVKMQLFAAWVNQEGKTDFMIRCNQMIDAFHQMLALWEDDIVQVTKDNIDTLFDNKKIGAILTIEGGEALRGELAYLRNYYRLGVRAITLTWNFENEIGYPASMQNSKGLKEFGIECIKEMNRLNIAIDVSHLNDAGFYDVLKHSSQPIMASHSNSRAVCDHFRNLTDEQILAIIEQNGYIGLNFLHDFLTKEEESSLDDVVKHAKHILDLGGEDVLGFGSDFDGIMKWPSEIKGAQDFQLIAQHFDNAGISGELLEKITHKNLARYMKQFV